MFNSKIFIISLVLIFISFFTKANAEKFACSALNNGKLQTMLFERISSSKFKWTTIRSKNFPIKILKDTINELILGESMIYNEGKLRAYYIVYIKKKTLNYRSGFIPDPNHDLNNAYLKKGTCIINQ